MATMAMRPTLAPLPVITDRGIFITASSWGLDRGKTGVIVTAGEAIAFKDPEVAATTEAVDIPAEEVLPARADMRRVTGQDRGIEMAGPLATTATARPRIAVVVPHTTTEATARPRTVTAMDRTAMVAVSATSLIYVYGVATSADDPRPIFECGSHPRRIGRFRVD